MKETSVLCLFCSAVPLSGGSFKGRKAPRELPHRQLPVLRQRHAVELRVSSLPSFGGAIPRDRLPAANLKSDFRAFQAAVRACNRYRVFSRGNDKGRIGMLAYRLAVDGHHGANGIGCDNEMPRLRRQLGL